MTKAFVLILGIVGLLWNPIAQAADVEFPSVSGWKQVGKFKPLTPTPL